MKSIKLSLWFLLLGLCALWWRADLWVEIPSDFASWRSSLINLTGALGIAAMSVALILAVRPARLEPFFGGLDKMYRLHRWLGITALTFATLHWLLTQFPGWLIELGWLERSARIRAPAPTEPVLRWLQSQHGLAEGLGEWAYYTAVMLIVLALVKWFPYRLFFKTHRLLAVTYLVLVYHSVVLMKPVYWDALLGPVIGFLMLGGSFAAFVILLRRIGLSRRTLGIVESVTFHAPVRVLEVAVQIKGHWPGHASGQFGFVTFDTHEGAHPFTTSSAWSDDGQMKFLIKDLGDYTRTLPRHLKPGDPVTIEGPYGQFNFNDSHQRQIWVGGGIGITPFLARLDELKVNGSKEPVDLFYATASAYNLAIRQLRVMAREAGVTLHVIEEAKDGRLTAKRICELVPNWQTGDIWFCGPKAFGRSLQQDFAKWGLARNHFHEELFDLR
jgi:predicted ferric reductase